MNKHDVEICLRDIIGKDISLVDEGQFKFRVLNPFRFNDGDHFSIFLKKEGDDWFFSDEGDTLIHLSYEIEEKDLRKGNRQKLLTEALAIFNTSESEGALIYKTDEKSCGRDFFEFVQAISKVADLDYLSRQVVYSTFIQDVKHFVSSFIPKDRLTFDWYDKNHDPGGHYTVDCRINGMIKPVLVFALPNDERVSVATISILQFERWKIPFRSIAIFEDQEKINRKTLARFTDVCDKQFSNLIGAKDRLKDHLEKTLSSSPC